MVFLCALTLALLWWRRHKQQPRESLYGFKTAGLQDDTESGGVSLGDRSLVDFSSGTAPPYSVGSSTAAVGEGAVVAVPLLRARRASLLPPLDKQADALLEKLRALYSHTEHGSPRQQVRMATCLCFCMFIACAVQAAYYDRGNRGCTPCTVCLVTVSLYCELVLC